MCACLECNVFHSNVAETNTRTANTDAFSDEYVITNLGHTFCVLVACICVCEREIERVLC